MRRLTPAEAAKLRAEIAAEIRTTKVELIEEVRRDLMPSQVELYRKYARLLTPDRYAKKSSPA